MSIIFLKVNNANENIVFNNKKGYILSCQEVIDIDCEPQLIIRLYRFLLCFEKVLNKRIDKCAALILY